MSSGDSTAAAALPSLVLSFALPGVPARPLEPGRVADGARGGVADFAVVDCGGAAAGVAGALVLVARGGDAVVVARVGVEEAAAGPRRGKLFAAA